MAFLSSSSLSGRGPRKSTLVSLYLLGPRSQNHKFSMPTLSPGAADLDLVAQVMTYLCMSQRPVGDAPSAQFCLGCRHPVEPRASCLVWFQCL